MSLSLALFTFWLGILGIIEGYVAEKAALEEALNLKEESERRLVVELENMHERFQELTQEQVVLGEDTISRKENCLQSGHTALCFYNIISLCFNVLVNSSVWYSLSRSSWKSWK